MEIRPNLVANNHQDVLKYVDTATNEINTALKIRWKDTGGS